MKNVRINYMTKIILKESRYRQLKRSEEALVKKVAPLVDKLHQITRQHRKKGKKT